MRRLLSLLLILGLVFVSGIAPAENVPGVEIIDVDRAKITGQATFYIYADETIYERLTSLTDTGEPADVTDVVDGAEEEAEEAPAGTEAMSPYVEAALAILSGLAGGLPADEAEASARYVLVERTGGFVDASILAFASYSTIYAEAAVSAMASLEAGFPSVEAYTAEAFGLIDEAAISLQAYDSVYDGLYQSYIDSAVTPESAAEIAQTVTGPAVKDAQRLFAEHVRDDADFIARLDAYAAGITGRKFVLGTDEEGQPAGVVVANINRVFTRGSVTVVLVGVSVQSAEAYDTSTIIMLGGSVEKITTGHMAGLFTEDTRVGRAFALNGSTQAHTGGTVDAAFADPDASIHGFDRVQNEFYLYGPGETARYTAPAETDYEAVTNRQPSPVEDED